MKRKFCLFLTVLMIFLNGCTAYQKENIPEDRIIYRLNWEGNELIFYVSDLGTPLLYTDGEYVYGAAHLVDSEDGEKRLFMDEISCRQITQEDELLNPMLTFEWGGFTASLYELDTAHTVTMHNVNYPQSSFYRFSTGSSRIITGYLVDIQEGEIEGFQADWEEIDLRRYQPAVTQNLLQYYNYNEAFIYENGTLFTPSLEIAKVSYNEKEYLQLADYRDYYDRKLLYYDLTDTQWENFNQWLSSRPLLEEKG